MRIAVLLLGLAWQESMDALLDAFGSDDPARRARAGEQILARWKEWKDADLEKLSRAASSPEADVAGRAKELGRRIALRSRLGTPLLEKFPDADRILCQADEGTRLAFLLEASSTAIRNEWPVDIVRPLALNAGLFPEAAASGRLLNDIRNGQHYSLAPLLLQLVQDGTPERRIEAIQLASGMGTREDCLPLFACIDDPDWKVRAAVVNAAGWRLRGLAAPKLKPMFHDPSVEVRRTLLSAVGQGRIAELAEDLVPFLKSEDAESRWRAAHSLGRLRSKPHAAAVAPLLEDRDPSVRAYSAEALGEMGAKEHAAAVGKLLKDPQSYPRHMAVRGLGTMDAREHADAVAVLLSDDEAQIRSDVASLLGRWRLRSRAKDLLPLLRTNETRTSAIFALEMIDAKETADALMAVAEDPEERLREGFYSSDRGRAVVAVGTLGAAEMAPRIRALAASKDSHLRASAFEALVRLGDLGSSDLMVNGLQDQSARSWAAHYLAMLGPRSLAPQVAQQLSTRGWLADTVVTALGGIGGDDAREALLPLLKDSQLCFRGAVWSIGRIGRPEDLQALLPLLAEDRDGIVALATGELAARGGRVEKELIERLSASTTFGARVALVRLGRKTATEQRAMLEETLRPSKILGGRDLPPSEQLSYGPLGIELHRALEATHEPEAFARFEKEFVLEKSIESLDDLRDLLRASGFTLDVASAVRWGRLPKGIRTTMRAVCDWMLDGNSEWQVVDDYGTGHERRVVLQGSTVKLLRMRRQVEYWQRRLEGN